MDGKSFLEHAAGGKRTPLPPWPWESPFFFGKSGMIHSLARLFVSGGLRLFRYLLNSGLFRDPGVIILSSHDHANFGAVDLKRVTTLVTLRRLNLVKHLEMFFNSLVHICLRTQTSSAAFLRQKEEDRHRNCRKAWWS